MISDDTPGLVATAGSALGARATLGTHGRWNGELAVLDAALDALGPAEASPLVIRVTESAGDVPLRIVALGVDHLAVATLTADGLRVARYRRER